MLRQDTKFEIKMISFINQINTCLIDEIKNVKAVLDKESQMLQKDVEQLRI